MNELPPELKIDVTERIAGLGRVAPDTLDLIDRTAQHRFEQFITQDDYTKRGGVGRIVEILNLTTRFTEKEIIEALEASDSELAESIKKRMFIFEDIVLLDDKAVVLVVEQADDDDLVLAVKGVEAEVKQKVLEACGDIRTKMILEKLEDLGPARLSDVEQAQQRIVESIRKLEDKGRIRVARGDETLV